MADNNSAFRESIVEHSLDALIAVSTEGIVLYWNPGAEFIFGYASAEVIGRSIDDLIIPKNLRQEAHNMLTRALKTGSANYESIRVRKDGSLVYVDVSKKTVLDEHGNVKFISVCKKDVTHFNVLRQAKLMEARYRGFLDSTPDAIVIINQTGRIVLVNSQGEGLFGYSREELLGQPVELLLPNRFHARHVGYRTDYFSEPRTRSMGAGLELYGVRKDGAEFPVEISLSPLHTEEGAFAMSAVRDISDRKKAEAKFKALMESAPDAMVIVDKTGTIVMVNSQTEALFGYARAELLKQKVEMLLPTRYRATHPELRNQFFTDPKVRPMGKGLELFGQRKNGSEFSIEISLSPLETEDGTLVSGAIRDISERKHFERALQEKNAEMERANLAKDHFLAGMSHELRTPLNAIIGFTGTLLMRLPGPLTADQEKQLKTIQTSGRHLLSLINDLLDLAKIESGKVEVKLEDVVCQEVIQEVAATLRPLAESKRLKFTVDMPEEKIVIQTDRRAFSQILINLINNGIKFTEVGGLSVVVTRREGNVDIAINDTGCGIKLEDHAKLFQAFTQLDGSSTRRHDGTGLGLHLCQKLAMLIGGRITFRSEYQKGSTFLFTLKQH